MTVSCLSARTKFPAQGLLGGKPGSLRRVYINDEIVHSMGRYVLNPGDTLISYEAGGGGFGSPLERDPKLVQKDIEHGYVSIDSASKDYGLSQNFSKEKGD